NPRMSLLPLPVAALARRLIEQHAGGHRYVETFHRAELRQAREEVAMLPREVPETRAFGAEHQHHGPPEINRVRILLRLGVRPHHPESGLFQELERADEV